MILSIFHSLASIFFGYQRKDGSVLFLCREKHVIQLFEVFVNSQSKFHSRKAVEFSMRNKRNLMWEKQDLIEKEVKNTTKN